MRSAEPKPREGVPHAIDVHDSMMPPVAQAVVQILILLSIRVLMHCRQLLHWVTTAAALAAVLLSFLLQCLGNLQSHRRLGLQSLDVVDPVLSAPFHGPVFPFLLPLRQLSGGE